MVGAAFGATSSSASSVALRRSTSAGACEHRRRGPPPAAPPVRPGRSAARPLSRGWAIGAAPRLAARIRGRGRACRRRPGREDRWRSTRRRGWPPGSVVAPSSAIGAAPMSAAGSDGRGRARRRRPGRQGPRARRWRGADVGRPHPRPSSLASTRSVVRLVSPPQRAARRLAGVRRVVPASSRGRRHQLSARTCGNYREPQVGFEVLMKQTDQ